MYVPKSITNHPEFPSLGRGETAVFKLARDQKPDALQVPTKSKAFDVEKQSMVEIGDVPATAEESKIQKPKAEPIWFLRRKGNMLVLLGDNPNHVALYNYLMAAPYCRTSVGKPWHVPTRNGESIYYLDEPEKEAKTAVSIMEKRGAALKLLTEMEEADIRFMAMGMGVNYVGSGIETYRNLMELAQEKPDEVLNFEDDEQAKAIAYVRAFEQAGLISKGQASDGRDAWVNVQTNKVLKAVGEEDATQELALVKYFETKPGKPVFDSMRSRWAKEIKAETV